MTSKKISSKKNERMFALGEFLKEARLRCELSQADVSKVLGFETPQLISNWENGRSSPPSKHIEKLCRLYQVDANEFFDFMVEYSKAVAESKTVNELKGLSIYRKRA